MSEREQETVHEEEIFVKALFFDIDGTLLSEITKEIPQSALDALKKTAEKGNLTFINTGRTWSELPEELKKLPFSGFLCGCGTYLRREVSRFQEVEQTRAHFAAVGIGLAETAETKGIIYDKFCIVTDAQSDIERMYREFEQEFDIMDRRGGVYELVPHGCSKGTAVDYALRKKMHTYLATAATTLPCSGAAHTPLRLENMMRFWIRTQST